VTFANALFQWQEGERRLDRSPPANRRTLERVTDSIVAELRRRLGGSFTTEELVELYYRGTDWCTGIAVALAPDSPWAWESTTVADAAFGRYLHEAADFAGGRRCAGAAP
jgi:hypothetical protein